MRIFFLEISTVFFVCRFDCSTRCLSCIDDVVTTFAVAPARTWVYIRAWVSNQNLTELTRKNWAWARDTPLYYHLLRELRELCELYELISVASILCSATLKTKFWQKIYIVMDIVRRP